MAAARHIGARDRERLIADHVAMATRIALRVARRTPGWVSRDDLISAAMIGLAEAADRYDAHRGEPFVGFATKRIRGAVLDELRRGDVLPRRIRQNAQKIGEVMRTLEQQLGRPPDDEDIAGALDVPVEDYLDDLTRLYISLVSIDDLSSDPEAQEDLPSRKLEREELIATMKEGLSKLPERDAQILTLYYTDEMTYAEIGDLLGITESRVCQLHARALSRMRHHIEPSS